MKIKIKISIIAMVISTSLLNSKIIAQVHTNSWFRTTLNIAVTERIKTDLELQHRRQNGFENSNLLDKNLMYSFRSWIYFKHNKNLVFAISPFAYFSNYKIIQKESDAVASPANEFRFCASVEFQHELANNFFIVNRLAQEYRIFEGAAENVFRSRNRLAFRYDFTSKLNASLGDELFINVSGTDEKHVFDHNRLYINISIKPSPTVKVDFGYIYISRLMKVNTDVSVDNNFYLNFTYLL